MNGLSESGYPRQLEVRLQLQVSMALKEPASATGTAEDRPRPRLNDRLGLEMCYLLRI